METTRPALVVACLLVLTFLGGVGAIGWVSVNLATRDLERQLAEAQRSARLREPRRPQPVAPKHQEQAREQLEEQVRRLRLAYEARSRELAAVRQELNQYMQMAEEIVLAPRSQGKSESEIGEELSELRTSTAERVADLTDTDEDLQMFQEAMEAEMADLALRFSEFHLELRELVVAIGEPAIPALVTTLQNSTRASIRAWAAEVLGQLGVSNQQALDALSEAMSDPDRDVAGAAAASLQFLESRP